MSDPVTTSAPYVSPRYTELTYIANMLRCQLALIDYDKGQSLLLESRMTTDDKLEQNILEERTKLTAEYVLVTDALRLVQELITGTIQMSI